MRFNSSEPGQWHSATTSTERHRRFRRGVGLVTVLGILCLILAMAIRPAYADRMSATQPNHQDIEMKIGQMLMIGFRGLTADAHSPIMEDIRRRHIGGVILFDYDVPLHSPVRNIKSPAQVKQLTSTLQQAASTPLFIAIDQEGGKVNRLKEKFGFPATPSARQLGVLDNVNVTRQSAEITAASLASAGINVNFAPVVDLDINPDNPVIGKLGRSFSADPEVVTRHAATMIDAFHEYHVLSAIKHFPGHGSSTEDSHYEFTDVTDTWRQEELAPFQFLVQRGTCDMVMTAHIFNARLDPRWPATLSNDIITGILRKRLRYDGVIISDDMQMKAISDYVGFEKAVERVILAGVDILLFPNNSSYEEDIARHAVVVMKRLLAEGIITPERIDDSYRRIMILKRKITTAVR